MKKYIFVLIASMMATIAKAQSITLQQEREFYQKVYSLFNEYAQSAAVSDEEEEYTFRKLFVNNDLQIGNDLMSLSRESKLSVDDYVATLQKAKRVKVVVKSIKKDGPLEDNGDEWVLPIAFEKAISYSNCGTLFSSYDYFGEYYRLRAVVSLNKGTKECYISELNLDPKYKALDFPEDFTVLERTREDENKRNYLRDNKLTINGRDVKWNLYGQVILHPGDKIKYNNSDIEPEVITDGKCGGTKIHANYSDKSYRVRANMGFALSGFNKLSDAYASITTPTDNEMSFGIDLGYVLPSTSKFYVGFFAGIGLSSNNLKMTMPSGNIISVDCSNENDEDGNAYKRYYDLTGNGVIQELKASDLTIPIYADFEYQIIPILSAYADLGVRIQMSSGKWSANVDGYETSGVYSQYNNLEIRGGEGGREINLNGFGKWGASSLDVDDTGWESKMTINVLTGLGLRANLTKSVAIDAGIQYIMSGNSWDGGNRNPIFSYTLPQNATTPAEKAKGDKVNLLNNTGGIKHSALRVAASLIYKF